MSFNLTTSPIYQPTYSELETNSKPESTDNWVNINNHTNSLAETKAEITNGIRIVKENIDHGFTGDLATLKKILQLLNHPSITEANITVINKQVKANKNCYTVVFDDKKLFSITLITGETRFPTETTRGDDVSINLKDGFYELCRQLDLTID